jgi:hypothetical protein
VNVPIRDAASASFRVQTRCALLETAMSGFANDGRIDAHVHRFRRIDKSHAPDVFCMPP